MGRNKRIRAEQGSGNVFADLDLPHAEQELLKARLTLQIYRIIKDRGLTQARAGAIHERRGVSGRRAANPFRLLAL